MKIENTLYTNDVGWQVLQWLTGFHSLFKVKRKYNMKIENTLNTNNVGWQLLQWLTGFHSLFKVFFPS
jgi:hypothetical protein